MRVLGGALIRIGCGSGAGTGETGMWLEISALHRSDVAAGLYWRDSRSDYQRVAEPDPLRRLDMCRAKSTPCNGQGDDHWTTSKSVTTAPVPFCHVQKSTLTSSHHAGFKCPYPYGELEARQPNIGWPWNLSISSAFLS